MKNNKLLKSASILMILASAIVFSCNEDERLSTQDTQDISEEALTDSYFQDTDDMAGVAVEAPNEAEYSGGREKGTITVNDSRFQCNGTPLTVTLVKSPNSTPANPSGVITVDFGTEGCKDTRENVRKGKLIFTYNGRRFTPGATVVTTTENYYINGVKLEGTRTLTNVSSSTTESPKFNVVVANGKATFENGEVATRESNITYQWVKATNPVDNKLIIDQSSTSSGVTRGGRKYEMSLLKALEYKRFCGIAVSGIKRFVIDGAKEITIDYGDGTCDKSMTVTVNGVTRNITVN